MKNKIIKALLLTFSILLIIRVILYLFPFIINLSTHEGQLAFKNEIDNLGVWGIIVLFMLQLLQIVLVVLPGEPLEILAGMCYGPIGGTIFIIVSVFITTTLIYLLVGKFGKKYLYNTFSKEKIQKIENSKLFKNPKKAEVLMCILFFTPGTPKDLLTYIGFLFPIPPIKFILIATFLRFPSIISSTIAGSGLSNGRISIVIVSYVITFVATAIFVFLISKKEKDTTEAIKILK